MLSVICSARVSHQQRTDMVGSRSSRAAIGWILFTFPDRPHRRERLIDLFWPELDTERGRRAMNSAVWRCGAACVAPEYQDGHGLRTVGPETILEKTPWLDVDTWALLHAARSTLSGSEAQPDHRE